MFCKDYIQVFVKSMYIILAVFYFLLCTLKKSIRIVKSIDFRCLMVLYVLKCTKYDWTFFENASLSLVFMYVSQILWALYLKNKSSELNHRIADILYVVLIIPGCISLDMWQCMLYFSEFP